MSALLKDVTGNKILDSINVQNGLLAQLVRHNAVSEDISWAEVRSIVQSGQADKAFSVGDQLITKLTDGGTVYDCPWDVVGFGTEKNRSGETIPVMYLQMHYTLPFATSFDAREAFYTAGESGLAAGTYNIKLGWSQGTMVKDKSYQFTLTEPLVKGNQLLGFTGGWDSAASGWKVNVFDSASATKAKATLAVTEGTGGTNLGTVMQGPNGDLWSFHATVYGNNDWEDSNLRQWLNSSAASWYKPTHDHDHIPCADACYGAYDSKPGFISMLPDDFVAAVAEIEVDTARNYISYGGTSGAPTVSKTFDRFFLPSLEQHWIACNEQPVVGIEGAPWEYWKRARGASSKAPLWQVCKPYIQYALNAKTSPQYSWVRSAYRDGAYTPFIVTADGIVNYYYAYHGHRAAAACAIG